MAMIKIANAGLGVNYDLTPEELPDGVWTDVQNMRFKDGYPCSYWRSNRRHYRWYGEP